MRPPDGVAPMSAGAAAKLDPAELQRPLPRGRNKLPREVVVANQLARLLWATALEIDERGYSAITVADITARARVSRLTFYELFDNKLDCVLAAQRVAIGRLRELIARAYEAEPSWGEGVAAALAAVLSFVAAAPEEANLLRISSPGAAEPELAERGQAALEELATAMRARRGERDRSDSSAPALREQAAIGGAAAVIGAKLLSGEPEFGPELRAELTRLILAPYLGDEEAMNIAAAA
jgi:AcrR family transcriptional regulator